MPLETQPQDLSQRISSAHSAHSNPAPYSHWTGPGSAQWAERSRKLTLGEDPGYGCYPTADGRWLALSIAFEDHFWRHLCAVLDLPGYAELDGTQRVQRRTELLLGDPHLHARGMLAPVSDEMYLRQPLVIDGRAPGPRSGCPALGEHTEDVLSEAGLGPAQVATLLQSAAAGGSAPAPIR